MMTLMEQRLLSCVKGYNRKISKIHSAESGFGSQMTDKLTAEARDLFVRGCLAVAQTGTGIVVEIDVIAEMAVQSCANRMSQIG